MIESKVVLIRMYMYMYVHLFSYIGVWLPRRHDILWDF